MSRSPSLPERPHPDLDPEMSDAERLSVLRQHFERVVDVNCELDQWLQNADDRHAELIDEVDQMKTHNEALKTTSYYIATVEELIDGGVIIEQHGNNQEALTEFAPSLNIDDIEPNDRVVIDDSLAAQTVLDDETDAWAQAMEVVESPAVAYDDIGGIDEQVHEVREAVEQPLENPEMFAEIGIDPPSGVLLYGPPGTGKTMLAKVVASETSASSIKMADSELVQKLIGEGARLVRDLFKLAAEREPAVVFTNGINTVASKRTGSKTSGDAEVQRTMMQLLSEMDGFDGRGDIRIIVATNRFDMLDEAVLWPGRFDRLIEVSKPAAEGRRHILDIHTRDMNVADDVDLDALAEGLDDYSGADIASLTTEVGMFAIRDDRTEVTDADFDAAHEKLSNVDESGTGPISGFTDYQYWGRRPGTAAGGGHGHHPFP